MPDEEFVAKLNRPGPGVRRKSEWGKNGSEYSTSSFMWPTINGGGRMRHTVLCVDDELDTLAAYRRFLETDYEIRFAESGEQALSMMAEKGPFAVVVSDLQMQGMDGIHLLSIVREKYPESVRILLTGQSDLEHAIQAVNDGHLFRFLTKPCRPVTLSDAVKAAVTQHELIINNRKQVREGPRAGEDLSRAVLDSVRALIAVLDRNGTVVAVNTAWNKFGVENEINTFGGSAYLKAGVNYIEVCRNGQGTFSEQASPIAGGIRAVLNAEQRSFELEYPCRTKDGQRYFMLSVTPLSAAGGGAVMSHTDITERVLAEHALRASEDRYRQVLKDQTEVVCRTRYDGTITFVSEVFCRVVGKTAEQLLGYKWHQVPGLNDVAGIQASLNQMTPANPVVRIENRISDAEGSVRWMEFVNRGFYDSTDRLIEVQAVGRDMTERRRAEAAVLLRDRAIHAVTQGIVITDPSQPDNPLVYVNSGFEKMTGYEEQDVLGRNCRFLQGAETDPREVARLRDAIRFGEPCTVVLLNYRKDGTRFWSELSISPVRDEEGVITHFVGVQADVTGRRMLEVQLRQAQKLESIGQLAAGVAHEINTPVQYLGDNTRFLKESFEELRKVIEMYRMVGNDLERLAAVEHLSKEIDLDYLLEEAPRAFDQTLEGIGHVAKIVKAMKEFAHPGSDEKSPVDLNHSIETVIAVARNEWKYVAKVQTDLAENLPCVPGLPGELNQVFLNLLVNAAHAVQANGGTPDRKGRITFTTRRAGSAVEVRVEDTGCGIPESARNRIFDPFFTTKPLGQGTGQGLALVHSVVVQRHGGTITFESQVGQGTAFVVRLPASEVPRAFSEPTDATGA